MATLNHIIKVPLDGTTFTVNIRPVYTREFHLRMWLGLRLLYMAAWVLGCNFQFDGLSDESEEQP